MATPTLPVMRDQPSAAWVAPSSCRMVRCLILVDLERALYSGRMAAPGIPKQTSTPSLSRIFTTASITGILGIKKPPNFLGTRPDAGPLSGLVRFQTGEPART